MFLLKIIIVTKRIWIGTMSGNNNSPNNAIASQNPRNLEMILFSFNCHYHPRTFFSIKVYDKNIATGETSQVITSRHFSSLLFTSMSILTSLALINWKANTIHIHISNNSTFPFISLHFILSLLLSIERQKQYKYINKAIQKAQLSSYILVTHTEIFLDTLKPRLYKKFYQIL